MQCGAKDDKNKHWRYHKVMVEFLTGYDKYTMGIGHERMLY